MASNSSSLHRCNQTTEVKRALAVAYSTRLCPSGSSFGLAKLLGQGVMHPCQTKKPSVYHLSLEIGAMRGSHLVMHRHSVMQWRPINATWLSSALQIEC